MSVDLSIVIACYREEGHLERNVDEVIRALKASRYSWELILVDDCSPDRTREEIARVLARHPREAIRTILHESNTGRGRAVSDGLRAARGRIAGFLDIDLATPAYYLPVVAAEIDRGADLATAHRIYKFRPGVFVRWLCSVGYRCIMRRALRVPLQDTETGFKLFRREAVLPVLDRVKDPHWFWDTEIMVRSHLAGLRIVEFPTIFIRDDGAKKSTVRLARDIAHYLRNLWSFRREVEEIRRGRFATENPEREREGRGDEKEDGSDRGKDTDTGKGTGTARRAA